MEKVKVPSISIDSVSYDESSATFEVEFQNGAVCRYYDVPSDIYQRFLRASSHLGFLHAFIKDSYKSEPLPCGRF